MRIFLSCLCCFFVLVFFAAPAVGQITGDLQIVVSDPAGAAVPGRRGGGVKPLGRLAFPLGRDLRLAKRPEPEAIAGLKPRIPDPCPMFL